MIRGISTIPALLLSAVAIACAATPARAAGILIAEGPFGTSQLAIQEQTVRVTINNGIAVTHITQVFQNAENRQVEALYSFPVPRGASVSNFSMWINGKEMTGEVIEKERAREIYDSYKQRRQDPGLLEQTSYRTFEMRVFPIAPMGQQRIQVTYAQQLDFDHDTATYVYPLATSTRRDFRSTSAGKFSFTLDARSAVPFADMRSPSHEKDFAIARHGENYQQASLELTDGSLARDVVVNYTMRRPVTGIDVITSRQDGEDGYFLLTLTAGEELAPLASAMDYVFVLDISGSMQDDGKLATSRKSLEAFINALGKDDRFEVLTFNNGANALFSSLHPADEDNKVKAETFLGSQQARGGTVLSPAMNAAYRYRGTDAARPLNVVLLSDGLTEQGENSGLIKLIRGRPENTRVFCIGVGNDVNRALLEQMANDAGGLAAFISREDDFTRQAQAFQRKLTRPVATDLKIDVGGAGVYDVEPATLPNLYFGAPVRMYGRYKKPGASQVTVSGMVNGQALRKSVEIDLPAADPANPEIERMWAWQRVDRLQKEADAQGSRSPIIPEIIRLGEGYSIVTEYTSFLVLENDAEYQRWKIDRRNALRITRDKTAQERVQAQLAKIREENVAIGPAESVKTLSAAAAPGNPPPNAPAFAANPATPSAPRQSRDIGGGGGGGGGGGAIDPLTAGFALGVGGLALLARRRSKTAPHP